MEAQIRAQELTLRATRNGYWPTLNLVGRRRDARGSRSRSRHVVDNFGQVQPYGGMAWNLLGGAQLVWPIFQGFLTRGQVHEADAVLDGTARAARRAHPAGLGGGRAGGAGGACRARGAGRLGPGARPARRRGSHGRRTLRRGGRQHHRALATPSWPPRWRARSRSAPVRPRHRACRPLPGARQNLNRLGRSGSQDRLDALEQRGGRERLLQQDGGPGRRPRSASTVRPKPLMNSTFTSGQRCWSRPTTSGPLSPGRPTSTSRRSTASAMRQRLLLGLGTAGRLGDGVAVPAQHCARSPGARSSSSSMIKIGRRALRAGAPSTDPDDVVRSPGRRLERADGARSGGARAQTGEAMRHGRPRDRPPSGSVRRRRAPDRPGGDPRRGRWRNPRMAEKTLRRSWTIDPSSIASGTCLRSAQRLVRRAAALSSSSKGRCLS